MPIAGKLSDKNVLLMQHLPVIPSNCETRFSRVVDTKDDVPVFVSFNVLCSRNCE
jgi:hypothetical protein